jgi:hypothetical protein
LVSVQVVEEETIRLIDFRRCETLHCRCRTCSGNRDDTDSRRPLIPTRRESV